MFDANPGKRPGGFLIADGIPDLDRFDAGQHSNIPGLDFLNLQKMNPLKYLQLGNFKRRPPPGIPQTHQVVPGMGGSVENLADRQTTDVIRVGQIRYQHLEWCALVIDRPGDLFKDGIK